MTKINEALEFIIKKHADQTRKDGSPYVWHPIKVALMTKEQGYGEDFQLVL